MVNDSKGFFSFSESVSFFSRETLLEVLGLAPVSEEVLRVVVEEETELEGSCVAGVEAEICAVSTSAVEGAAGDKRLVEAELLDPKDDVVDVVVVSVPEETMEAVLLLDVVVFAAELVEVPEATDAAVEVVVVAIVDGDGTYVEFLATTALYCCISITAASSNTCTKAQSMITF